MKIRNSIIHALALGDRAVRIALNENAARRNPRTLRDRRAEHRAYRDVIRTLKLARPEFSRTQAVRAHTLMTRNIC